MSVQDLIAKYRVEIATYICTNGFNDLGRFVAMLFEDLIYEKFMEQVNDEIVAKIRTFNDGTAAKIMASKHLQSNAEAFMEISAVYGRQIAEDVIEHGFSRINGNLMSAVMVAGQRNLLNVE